MEEWKQIESFPDYEVSSLGRVKSKGNILKPQMRGKYLKTSLCSQGSIKQVSIHRLVGLTFLSNPDSKPVIDHINNDKLDNRLENLRWATHSENQLNKKYWPSRGTNTGERNISFTGGRYQVTVCRNYSQQRKCFATLEEAIQFRDKLQ
jgi:hypothetical protein